ncbi:hypothetical protein B0H14DRAFT_3165712 [Mycena olivaceomarginata]|nr:hypothetical protein B0H14DRAFT_3165712 [Mycena olivaceomarginata]
MCGLRNRLCLRAVMRPQAPSSASASLPRYIAMSLNRSYSTAINDSLNGARAALDLSVTVIEAVIDFFVNTYRSTFLCFLQLVLQAGVAVLAAAVAEATTVVESAANGIANNIHQTFSAATSAVQSAISAANRVPGINIPTPNLSPPDLSSLQSLTLPTTLQDQLTNLNNQLPTLDELRQIVDNIINTPFSDLKGEINATFASLSTDPNLLPVPSMVNIEFCDKFDTSMIDNLSSDLKRVSETGTMLALCAAISIAGTYCLVQWGLMRGLTAHLSKIANRWNIGTTPEGNLSESALLSMSSEISHPLLCLLSKWLHLRSSPEWLLYYVFCPPALSCLFTGVCGIIVVQLQILDLHRLRSRYWVGKISVEVVAISNVIYTSLNSSITGQSVEYAQTLNSQMDGIQTAVNSGIFGWINTTTTVLNDTIAGAYADIQTAINTAFGGTMLDSPMQNLMQCILGNKVDEIETALTFLQSNLVFDIPRLNSSALLLSQDAIEEVVQAIAEAAVGGSAANPAGLVGNIVEIYEASLKKEQLMYAIFMALWIGVIIMGIGFIIVDECQRICRRHKM